LHYVERYNYESHWRAAGKDSGVRFQCCFCGKTIKKAGPDAGLLAYTTCFDGERSRQFTQSLFCHVECLRAALYPGTYLDVPDDLLDSDEDKVN
jgi:hypothetical protein